MCLKHPYFPLGFLSPSPACTGVSIVWGGWCLVISGKVHIPESFLVLWFLGIILEMTFLHMHLWVLGNQSNRNNHRPWHGKFVFKPIFELLATLKKRRNTYKNNIRYEKAASPQLNFLTTWFRAMLWFIIQLITKPPPHHHHLYWLFLKKT